MIEGTERLGLKKDSNRSRYLASTSHDIDVGGRVDSLQDCNQKHEPRHPEEQLRANAHLEAVSHFEERGTMHHNVLRITEPGGSY